MGKIGSWKLNSILSVLLMVACVAGAADVSYAKEREIKYLDKPYISTKPADMKDGIPVGELGVDGGDKAKVLAFADEIEKYTDDKHKTDSLLISYKGKLIFESYYRRGRENYPHYQMSITKSYTALALGRAIQLGHFSMDDLYKPAVSFLKDVDQSKLIEGADSITLDNAMHMGSGIRLDGGKIKELMKDQFQLKGQGQIQAYLQYSAPIPKKEIKFKYQASDPALAMQVVEAVVPGSAKAFIKDELLGKIGITNYGWQKDLSGLPKSAAGCSIRSRDMLKIGMMVMNGGKWKGEQLIPEEYIKRCISPLAHSYGTSYYGYFWWVDDFEVGNKTYHCPAGRGAGGQYIFMFPELELIAVITAHNKGMGTMLQDAAKRIIPAFVETPADDAEKHLFILSGQSNMDGMNPEESFIPTVEKQFGKESVIVVKDAQGGQPIRRWYKNWKPAKGDEPKADGELYDKLMGKVNEAIKDKHIKTVSFLWMQGERDANESHGEVYRESFEGLVKQLEDDLGRKDINVVIGRLSDFDLKNEKYPHWTMVRDAQVAMAEANKRWRWIDTDDLNTGASMPNWKTKQIKQYVDDLHMSAQGYKFMGQRFAEQAIELIGE